VLSDSIGVAIDAENGVDVRTETRNVNVIMIGLRRASIDWCVI